MLGRLRSCGCADATAWRNCRNSGADVLVLADLHFIERHYACTRLMQKMVAAFCVPAKTCAPDAVCRLTLPVVPRCRDRAGFSQL